MISSNLRLFVFVATMLVAAVILQGCGGGLSTPNTPATETVQPVSMPASGSLPLALPVDQAQPWETISAGGYVDAAGDKTGTMVNLDSIFTPGVEWHLASPAGVAENLEAARLDSGTPGENGLAWAVYRLVLEGVQPGIVSLDVNPSASSSSSYYVALADYSAGSWEWHGPFSGNHVRLNTGARVTAGADYVSDLGNLFILVAAWDGVVADVVGVAANTITTPGPAIAAPGNLTAVPGEAGGVILTWDAVTGDNLAGYQVYWSYAEFGGPTEDGVQAVASLTGRCEYVLPTEGTDPVHVRVASVDLNGDVRGLSAEASATPLTAEFVPSVVRLEASQPSCLRTGQVVLTARGMDIYDWDLDGDGVYEVEDDTSGTQYLDTSSCGMLRPAVRGGCGSGWDSGRGVSAVGNWVDCAAVSVLVEWNTRPLAIAHANPVNGLTPLQVTFTGEGIDDDGTIVQYAWDFDDDGTYDYTSADNPNPDPQTFIVTGIYNVRFRVDDNDGSYDVDTIAISVTNDSNVAPEADLAVGPGQETGSAPHTVDFDASGSTDSDGAIVEYHWDFDGDGAYDRYSTSPTESYTYTAGAEYTATVRVMDDCYATDTASVTIDVTEGPVAVLVADDYDGDAPFRVYFDASGSYDNDGVLMDYEWDFDGDGLFSNSAYEIQEHGNQQTNYLYQANVHQVSLRITDNDGLQDTDTVTITSRGWGYRVILEPDDNVYCIGAEDVDGYLGVCYKQDLGSSAVSAIRFMRAGDEAGETWGAPLNVVADADWVHDWSFTLIGGYPALAYYEMIGDTLWYVQATETDGSAWGAPVAVHTGLTGCDDVHMVEVNGNPAIAYFAADDYDQLYRRADDATGSTWGAAVVVNNGNISSYLRMRSLAVADGYPVLSYQDPSDLDLYILRAADINGATWHPAVKVFGDDASHSVGAYSSVLEVDGYPGICFGGGLTSGCLSFMRADDASGASWGDPATLVQEYNILGETFQTRIIGGVPMVAYRVRVTTLTYIYFQRALDAHGLNWDGPEMAHWPWTSCLPGSDYAMCAIAGEPVIVYSDDSNLDLRLGFIVD